VGKRVAREDQSISPEDQRKFDRWLTANALLSSIFEVGLIAMAVAGFVSEGARDAAVAETTKTSDVVASKQGRLRTGVRNVQYRHE
jgi:hypothetical protein